MHGCIKYARKHLLKIEVYTAKEDKTMPREQEQKKVQRGGAQKIRGKWHLVAWSL